MRPRLVIEWLIIVAISVVFIHLASQTTSLRRLDNLIYGGLLSFGEKPARPDLLLVAIDERSLGQLGQWPWPRAVHAELLDKLAAARPKAIGYDVLFVDPGQDDPLLVAAVRKTPHLVLPMAFTVPGNNGAPFDANEPISGLRAGGASIGHANVVFDSDGVVRRVGMVAERGSLNVPHLGEAIVRQVVGHDSSELARVPDASGAMGGLSLEPTLGIPFVGPAGSYPTVSFVDVLRGTVPQELLRNRIILIGSTAQGSGDQYPVPAVGAAGSMPGVEILANIVNGLLTGSMITNAPAGAQASTSYGAVLILLIGFLLLPPRFHLLAATATLVAVMALSAILLVQRHVWLAPATSVIGIVFVYPIWSWRRLATASAFMDRELRRLTREPDALPGGSPPVLPARLISDTIEQQTMMLGHAITRVRDLRRFFADAVESLPDPTLVLGRDGNVLVANRAAVSLFRRPVDHLWVDEPFAPLLALHAGGAVQPADGAECEIVMNDRRTFIMRNEPLMNAREEHAGTIVSLSDITAIRVATRQREEALELISHDMRSPQASILALLEQLEPMQSRDSRIADYAHRTLKLADDFVQLARAEAEQYAAEPLDLSGLLIEAADDQWALADRAGVRIETPDEEREFLVSGDRSLLRRVLVNLIGNAIKHSDPGTVIRCRLRSDGPGELGPASLPVDCDEATARRFVCCDITDEGCGIAPADIARLFNRFERASGSGRRDVGGAGLGLLFVRTVVERHDGEVSCRSMVGLGSTFAIRLPLMPTTSDYRRFIDREVGSEATAPVPDV